MIRLNTWFVFAAILAAMVLCVSNAALAEITLAHRYDFNSVNDTVGTANGTLVGSATLAGGALVTDGGNGAVNGNWNANGPRMTLDPSAVSGITGPFTIEDWFTCTTGWPKFDTIYAFSDNTTDNYLLAAPVRGYDPWPSGVGIRGAGGDYSGWDLVLSGIWLDTPSLHQTVLTYDGSTFSYYVDGVLANYNGLASTGTDNGFNLSLITDIGINGGSPWNDPTLTGSNFDFRIYSGALSASQVASVYALGSDASNSDIALAVPEPATWLMLTLAGALGLLYSRIRRK